MKPCQPNLVVNADDHIRDAPQFLIFSYLGWLGQIIFKIFMRFKILFLGIVSLKYFILRINLIKLILFLKNLLYFFVFLFPKKHKEVKQIIFKVQAPLKLDL